MRIAALFLIFLISTASSAIVAVGDLIPMGDESSRGLYQCDDDASEYFWNADFAGEGMANLFNAGGIAQIDTIYLTVQHSTGTPQPVQSIYVCVWADAGGVPGAVLYQGLYNLPVPDPGFYWWVTVDLSADAVVTEGAFWIGYLDDGSMTYQPLLDNPTGCISWMYTPSGGWEDLEGYAGISLGLYFRAWASEGVPVELVSFDAEAMDGAVRLEWSTATEQNNYGFYILRSFSADDGYDGIGEMIPGAGISAAPNHYSFTDGQVEPGIRYYYKLVDVDTAGSESFHGPVSARLTPGDAQSWGEVKAEFK